MIKTLCKWFVNLHRVFFIYCLSGIGLHFCNISLSPLAISAEVFLRKRAVGFIDDKLAVPFPGNQLFHDDVAALYMIETAADGLSVTAGLIYKCTDVTVTNPGVDDIQISKRLKPACKSSITFSSPYFMRSFSCIEPKSSPYGSLM